MGVFLKHNIKKIFLLYLVVPKPLFVFLRPFLEANISSIFFGFDFLHTALNYFYCLDISVNIINILLFLLLTCLASATQRCASAPSSVSGRPKSVVIFILYYVPYQFSYFLFCTKFFRTNL